MSDPMKLTPAQQAASIDRVHENIALLSGAGCGKTFVLARRIAELLLAGGEDPLSRLVALTFTEKAATEMLQRIRKMLSQKAEESRSPDRERIHQWLLDLPKARISTIHSFCSTLLRSHAVEAGLDPGFNVCSDELLQKQMLRNAIDQTLLESVEKGGQETAELLQQVPYDRAMEHIELLVENRTTWRTEEYADPKTLLDRWQNQMEIARQTAWRELTEDPNLLQELNGLESAPCNRADDKLDLFRHETLAVIRTMLDDPDQRNEELLSNLSLPGNKGSASNWGGKETLIAFRKRLREVIVRMKEMALYCESLGDADHQAAQLLVTFSQLAQQANQYYIAEKRQRSLLDFNDLIQAVHTLLSENPTLTKKLSESFDQLLIDEAQDTDRFQIELLKMLASGQSPPETLPPGRLFLVGDSKQSIYRFRGAQVEAFENLCHQLGERQQEKLDLSFRTHAAGVAFVNPLFEKLMDSDYEPMKAHRTHTPPQPSVEILLARDADDSPANNAAQATTFQARCVAQRIEELITSRQPCVWDKSAQQWRPAQYGDIAILFSRMTNTLEYERQLAKRNIPYYVIGGAGFFKRQEVYDVLNALQVTENPYDDIAWIGLIRSDMIGLDDHALLRLADHFEPPYLPPLLADPQRIDPLKTLSEDQRGTLRQLLVFLADLRKRKDSLSLDQLIEAWMDETGYEATLLTQFHGRQALGNIRQLSEQARTAHANKMTLAEFIAHMNEQIVGESRYEQAAIAGEQGNLVRIMTIHKAKGLEFPVVILPDLNSGRRGVNSALLHRKNWGWTYKLKWDEDPDEKAVFPVSYRLSQAAENQDDQREHLRRFYVAATRHEDLLICVGADHRSAEDELKDNDSYIRKMDDVLHFSEALARNEETLEYGNGYQATVRYYPAQYPPWPKKEIGSRREALARSKSPKELVDTLLSTKGIPSNPLPWVGILPPEIGRVEIAPTALVDFVHCPMRYLWQHQWRIPQPARKNRSAATLSNGLPDAATLGTLYHCCMERLDPKNPQSPESLILQAASESGMIENLNLPAIVDDFEPMFHTFMEHPLWQELRTARKIFRELDFLMESGCAVLRGQIDLLFQAADGSWNMVDYKSDQVTPDQIASHAEKYALQMHIYAAAAERHLRQRPAKARLYFLRPAQSYEIEIPPHHRESFQREIEEIARQLIDFRRHPEIHSLRSSHCSDCAYQELCESRMFSKRN